MEFRKLGEFCTVKGGKRLPKGTQLQESKTNHPYLRIKDFNNGNIDINNLMYISEEVFNKISNYTINKGNIFLSIVGTIGLVDVIEEELDKSSLTENAVKIYSNDEKQLSTEFLSYFLKSTMGQHEISIRTVGSTQPKLAITRIKDINVPMVDIEKQYKITWVLSNIDKKIKLNRTIIANLEELSQTLFKRWFVDFEFPDENGNPYKSSGGKMIDSELGKIPNDWKISNFQEITAFNTEMVDTNQLENPLNYIGLEHISRNNIISIYRWENTSKVTGKKLKVCKGDILFGKLRPYFQKVGISPIDGVVSTDIMIFTPSFKNVYYFILLYLSQKNFIRYITSTSTGTRMPRTGKKQINSYKIVLPTNLILTSFNTILNRYTDLIELLINENAKLIQLRDTLLPKLMSGEIELPDDIEVNSDELSI